MINLISCPFCGHDTIDTTITATEGNMQCLCRGCGARGPEGLGVPGAQMAWNTRGDLEHPTELAIDSIKWNPLGNSTPPIHKPLLVTLLSGHVIGGVRYQDKQWMIPPVALGKKPDGQWEWGFPALSEDDQIVAWALHPDPYTAEPESILSSNGDRER